jgi:hypothetical protein
VVTVVMLVFRGELTQQVGHVPGVSPRQIPSGGMSVTPSGTALSVEGAILEPLSWCDVQRLWVKT